MQGKYINNLFKYNGSVVQLFSCFIFLYTTMVKKETLLKKLGQHIKKIRKEKGISQVELANSIGKDQQSIQRLEAGNVNPTYYYLCEICEGLDIKIEEIVKF